jgi:glycosyltransferase involved in cell wall biosynthesis
MVRQLARGLAQSGIETHIATTDDDGPGKLRVPFGVPIVENGVRYWFFPRQTKFYTFSWPLNVWLAEHVGEFDLVHIHALFSFAALPAAYWAHRRGVPYIVRPLGTLNEWGMTNRRPWLKKVSFALLERQVLKNAALVHYTSEQERDEARRLHVEAASAVIPNALADAPADSCAGQFLRRHPELQGRRVILFLSRIDRKKGLDLLLEAFARLRGDVPDAFLVIAGDGHAALAADLKRQAASLGISEHVLWTGFLAGNDKRAAFADASVYVLPSYSENFGIAAAEAMAAGLPVIVSDQVALHTDVADADAGLVVRCDAGEIASAMKRLLGDAALCAALGRNGRQLAARRYSPQAVTTTVLDAYERVAS